MTYKQLADKILALPPEQQNQIARYAPTDGAPYKINGLWIAEEDQVNPSGDGWEPVSTYAGNPDYADEPIVASKGFVILLEAEVKPKTQPTRTTLERVKAILVNEYGTPEDNVTPEALLNEHCGLDSLDEVEVTMTLEEEFGIKISDENAAGIRTVRDVVTLIDRLLNPSAPSTRP